MIHVFARLFSYLGKLAVPETIVAARYGRARRVVESETFDAAEVDAVTDAVRRSRDIFKVRRGRARIGAQHRQAVDRTSGAGPVTGGVAAQNVGRGVAKPIRCKN